MLTSFFLHDSFYTILYTHKFDCIIKQTRLNPGTTNTVNETVEILVRNRFLSFEPCGNVEAVLGQMKLASSAHHRERAHQ